MKCIVWLIAFCFVGLPQAHAWDHGSFSIAGKSVVNVEFGQNINVLKNSQGICGSGCGTAAWPSFLNADGYIASTDPSVDIGGVFSIPFSTYYGHYTLSYSGCGSLSIGSYAIVYSGGAGVNGLQPVGGASSGSTAFNLQYNNQCAQQTEFSFGGIFNAIANNGSGKVRLAFSVLVASNLAATGLIQLNNVNGITPGLYTFTNVNDAVHIDIPSLAYNGGTMSVNGGSPGAASEGILSPGQGSFSFKHGFTTTWTMSNALLCRTSDYAACVAGKQWNPDYEAQLKQLNPAFARFMDPNFTNNTLANNFTYRAKNSNFTFQSTGGAWVPSYWVGAIHNSGSDAYTSSNPSGSPASGAYVDGETVQGQIDIANSGNVPTLALSGRSGGAKPIFSSNFQGGPSQAILGGTLTAGDVIHFTATGTYISGGARTITYTLTSTNLATEIRGLTNAINADATLNTANIFARYNGDVITGGLVLIYNRNGQGVAPVSGTVFSATFTGTGGAETLSIGTMPTPTQDTAPAAGVAQESYSANLLVSLVYSKLLDGWITIPAGILVGVSVEAEAELCNAANVGCWINVPILYSGASITSFVQTVAANLNPGLNFGMELSNEVWNFSDQQTALAINLGAQLGFVGTNSNVIQYDSFYGLRFKQFNDLAHTAWTGAGQSRASMTSILADWILGIGSSGSDSQPNRLNGGQLVTTNLTYNALAGLGGTAGTTYTAAGSRPVDDADVVSIAPYWQGVLIGQFAFNWSGSASTYATILQAGSDYASGNPTLMASALSAIDTDSRNGFSNYPSSIYSVIQTVISSYDSYRSGVSQTALGRFDYEGGSQQGLGADFSGTQDVTGSPSNTGYAPLSAQFTSNGWSLAAYASNNACGLSTTNDIVACNVVTAYLAWKNSSLFQATVTTYLQQIATAHPGRASNGAWYGYTGPSLWEFFPGTIYGTPQTSYNAFQAFH